MTIVGRRLPGYEPRAASGKAKTASEDELRGQTHIWLSDFTLPGRARYVS
jgi:hypothetical protein